MDSRIARLLVAPAPLRDLLLFAKFLFVAARTMAAVSAQWPRGSGSVSKQSPIMLTNSEGKPWSESGFQGAWGKATMRAGIRGLTFHDLRGTAVVMLARAGCNEVEIYSITGHKPSDVRAILTVHYLPQDTEVASNAIAKLNRYKTRRDQTEDKILPTALPTALKFMKLKPKKE